ncbi:mediator of RNA polymerase II transcription subunit 7 [Aspergillus heteromorphus CBS 117.55]|uniref:Mediator of RNA polymerase II transcription subunit 7 n=1 Tax=Aspergillus heteromorphus CBS 117.55 TaxID=1448321 RepID=A0A317VD39_9EURO|nr:mediator of RNA polymerase II transcription subunit 7 [Aspergillus heteromorphus CBS 117.55]PWY70918.1 mediator of RNA polymerase II transcription subunit 7 [Aspergillus heteromorphus CBS 117.55]
MAEAAQPRPLGTAFAPPPPLWKHFTPENLKKLEEIKKEASKGEDGKPKKKSWSPTELRALDLPSELQLLVPPAIPTSGHYSVFGELQSLSTALPSLKDQGITQLYPSSPSTETDQQALSEPSRPLNHAYYLLKISKSLLLNFLEFVGVLSIAPEQFESKVEDLRNLFINAHHLLNLYRPHQARESLIMMMEEQLSRTREEIEQMDKLKVEITSVLERLEADGRAAQSPAPEADDDDGKKSTSEQKAIEDAQLLWDLLDGKIEG